MTPQDWHRARRVLQVALTCPPEDRRRSIAEQCGDNPHLRRQIEALLASYDDSTDLEAFLSQRRDAVQMDTLSASPIGSLDETRTATSDDFDGREPQPGSIAGARRWAEFALLEEIGEGAFGIVYRAWDSSLNREIALKIIDVRKLPNTDNRALLREGQMLARVHHHNVVTVYRAERIGQQVGLAMEYIEGRTLSNLVAQHGPLNAQEASLIGAALCDALAAVHRGGLVHRDVKASNVMRESGGRIVLMDFGAGRELLREDGTRSRVLGTPVVHAAGGPSRPQPDGIGGHLQPWCAAVLSRHGAIPGRWVGIRRGPRQPRRRAAACRCATFEAIFPTRSSRWSNARPTQTRQNDRARPAPSNGSCSTPFQARFEHKGGEVKHNTRETRARPARRWGQLALTQRIALSLVGGVLGLIALGFLTTLEFNSVLGRTGVFGAETPLGILKWGANSLLAPTIYAALILALFNVAVFILRFTGRVIPPVRRAAIGFRETTTTWARSAAIDEPNDLLRGLAVLGLAALVLVLWSFLPLLKAFTLQINQWPSADLAVLGSDNNANKFWYRRLLELDLLLLGAGLLGVLRLRRRKGTHLAPSAVASVIAVMGLVLVFLVGPWRLMFHSKFRQATLDGKSCFVLSTQGEDVLLHCPHAAPPRNRIVRATIRDFMSTGQSRGSSTRTR